MALLTLANLTHAHGDQVVLDGVSLTVNRGDRVGLVGRNGCGKTTLMRIVNGAYRPDAGQVQMSRGTRVGYLPQDPQLDAARTLKREAEQAFADLADLHDQLERVAHEMAEASDDVELERLMKRYERLEHRMQAAGGYAVEHRIEATLHGLGLGDETFDLPVAGLSGGQKARLALAKLLLSEPEVLLLDEPTNHLDIPGRQWLEQFLTGYPGAVLVVSHDRWLLDEVVDKIVELERGRLVEYPGNYHAFREQRAVRQLEQQRMREKQQTYIRHQRQFIDRYRAGQRAKQARGRESRLERYIENELVEQHHEQGVMHLALPPAPRCGDVVLGANEIAARYDENVLFEAFSFSVKRGQRIGVIGPNGCGKSTLVRTLIGRREPDAGTVRLGANVHVGYYHQTHEHLNDDDTPVSYLQRHLADGSEQSARDLAGAFLFSGDDQDKTFGVLSGGERTRAVLASLMVGGNNLLVLDEPSNHLDIPSAERLEQALKQYDGTLLLITHDRMLLQDTVDELLVFEPGGDERQPARVRHFLGSYREWLASAGGRQAGGASAAQATAAASTAAEAAPGSTGPPTDKGEPPDKADGRGRRKGGSKKSAAKSAKDAKNTKLWHLSDAEVERQIEQFEQKIAELDAQLADPDLYREKDRFFQVQQQREKLAARLTPLEDEWLTRAERE